jgi:hypothetical protein
MKLYNFVINISSFYVSCIVHTKGRQYLNTILFAKLLEIIKKHAVVHVKTLRILHLNLPLFTSNEWVALCVCE